VDIPTCKNIVIARVVNSMVEFKQIIGRGTRVRDDYDKYYFNILDYTGSATRLFADPDFDGEPALITEQEMTETGETITEIVTEEIKVAEQEEERGAVISSDSEGQRRKFYFDGGQVEIAAHLVYELDPDGRQLRVVKFTEYAAEKVRTLYPSAADLRRQWADPVLRAEIIAKLEERGIDFDQLRSSSNRPEADPFDLLCHLAFNAPLRTRRERADRVKKEEKLFFEKYGPEARAILSDLLEKYAEHGTAQFVIPDVLKVPPISERGNVIEIARLFGGAEKLREAVAELQSLLYAA
jgi:type I restriction enzyme R subunit